MDVSVGGISFELTFDGSKLNNKINSSCKKIENTFNKAFTTAGKSATKAIKTSNAEIAAILENTERSAKSKAASIAAIYRKQGDSQGEAFKKAWSHIERESASSSNKINNNFSDSFDSIAEKAKSLGKKMIAAFGVKQLVSFGKQCIDLGSDLQEVQNVVDTTFTSMSSKVDKFAKDSMKNYGLSETMSKRYTGTLGAMAKAFGFSEKQAYDMSTTLTGLAGDIASFYNITQDEAYNKVKAVFTGETEAIKELGVVMTQTALDSYALANGFGKTTSAMSEAEKVALRYAFVQEQLKTATGDFARTSNSWANQVRILTLQFESFKASIGQGLINVLTPAIQFINQLMSRLVALADAFSRFTGYFTKNNKAEKSAKAIADSYSVAAKASDSMAVSGTKAANKVGKAAEKAAKKIRSIMGFDQINKVSDSESTSTGTSSGAGGGTGGSSGVSANVDTGINQEEIKELPKIYQNLAKSIERFKSACSGLGKVISGGLKWGYENILKPLGEWTISKLAPKVLDVLTGSIRILTGVLELFAPLGKWLWEKFLSKIAKFAGDHVIDVLDDLAKKLEKIADFINEYNSLDKIKKKVKSFFTSFDKNCRKVEKRVDTFVDSIKKILKKWFSGKIEGVEEWFSGISEAFTETLENLGDSIPDMSEISEKITESIGEIEAKITAYFVNKKTELTKKWEDLTADVKEKVADLKAKVASKWSNLQADWNGVINNVKDKTADMKAKVASKWADLSAKWNGVVGNIKDKTANLKAKIATAESTIKNAWKKLSAHWKDKKAQFSLKFSAAASDLKGWVNKNVIDKVNSKFKKVPILKNHLIPRLAQGGYVAKNTPQLAMIGDNRHQGEVVSPEKKLEEMALKAAQMASSGGNAEMISLLRQILAAILALSLTVNLDGKDITSNVIKRINDITKSTGTPPIII